MYFQVNIADVIIIMQGIPPFSQYKLDFC